MNKRKMMIHKALLDAILERFISDEEFWAGVTDATLDTVDELEPGEVFKVVAELKTGVKEVIVSVLRQHNEEAVALEKLMDARER